MTDEMKTWLIAKHREGILQGVEMGIVQERERIIKLLETLKEWESPIPVRESHVDSIIALIKGDDK